MRRVHTGTFSCFVVLLDLSAAFDTVDHNILLEPLKTRIGLQDVAHKWMASYFSHRHQFDSIDGSKSDSQELVRGVPQRSLLGLILYSIYTLPLSNIVKRHQMSYHLDTDETQLYLSFDSNSPSSGTQAIVQLEACISNIHQWMLENKLKLNDDKTEFIKFLPQPCSESITPSSPQKGNENIGLSTKAKNLGVLLDRSLNLSTHISATCKSAFYQLHCLSRIKCYLTTEALQTAVHALILSKLDYCNS